MKPRCFNRPDFESTILVQDGWFDQPFPGDLRYSKGQIGRAQTRLPRMILIRDPMSKDCRQNEEHGEARRRGWACEDCRHFKA